MCLLLAFIKIEHVLSSCNIILILNNLLNQNTEELKLTFATFQTPAVCQTFPKKITNSFQQQKKRKNSQVCVQHGTILYAFIVIGHATTSCDSIVLLSYPCYNKPFPFFPQCLSFVPFQYTSSGFQV